jgi:hypothetical protein
MQKVGYRALTLLCAGMSTIHAVADGTLLVTHVHLCKVTCLPAFLHDVGMLGPSTSSSASLQAGTTHLPRAAAASYSMIANDSLEAETTTTKGANHPSGTNDSSHRRPRSPLPAEATQTEAFSDVAADTARASWTWEC